MGLLEECRELFGTDDLYKALVIDKKASTNEIKRAYHKLSLKVHPDRVGDNEKDLATKKFQALGKVYSILSEKETRAVYDDTGEVDDENDLSQDRDWYDYWRLLFSKISVKDIQEFEEKYKESAEELTDLKAAYIDYEGDMDEILDNVLCATVDDEDRFREILQGLVKKKELPGFDKFSKEKAKKRTQRQKKAEAEAAEAEEMKREMGMDGEDSLKAMILKKHKSREADTDNFFSHLEQKYAQPKKKTKNKK